MLFLRVVGNLASVQRETVSFVKEFNFFNETIDPFRNIAVVSLLALPLLLARRLSSS